MLDNRGTIVYIAGPYRANTIHGIVENIRKAERVSKLFWKKGYAVICPHLNSSLLDGVVDDMAFLAAGLEILSRCDMCVMCPGWEKSRGSIVERDFAIEKGIKFFIRGIIYQNKENHNGI